MSDSFLQHTSGTLNGLNGVYLWSTAVNWSTGIAPANGGSVVFNISGGSNPSAYDDIASLTLANLTMDAGYLAVTGALTISSLTFGSGFSGAIFTDDLLGTGPTTLTINSLNAGGIIQALGANAVTKILASSDPGNESYTVNEGGEIVLSASAFASTTSFTYQNSTPSGTFAFTAAGFTGANSTISNLEDGDSIVLNADYVSSIDFSRGLHITTNHGNVNFTNTSFGANVPTGYTVSTDLVTGLMDITFIQSTVSTFQRGTSGSYGIYTGVYLWSNTANWVGGVKPANGGITTFNISNTYGNPTGVDDIADLYLDSLSMPQGYLAVTGTLQIGALTLGTGTGEIFASTIPGNSSAALTIDSLAGSEGMFIGADGAGAVTTIDATTDPGEHYEATDGGEVVFNPAPNAASTLSFNNAPGSVDTFAFENAGTTVTANLIGVAVGDAIALPGSDISSVVFGASNLTIVSNLGTTIFDNVNYNNTDGEVAGYTVSTDSVTGLEKITFTQGNTDTFQLGSSGSYGIYAGVYLWSNASNWTNGLPYNGEDGIFNISNTYGNPTGVDDIADLYLDSLSMPQGYVAVTGTLQIGKLTLGAGTGEIFASTIPGNSSAALTIDGLAGSEGMFIGADGAGAVTTIDATTDPGEYYEANEGGEVVFNPAPSAASYLSFGNAPGGYVTTFAFENPGATVAANLDGVAVGDAIALPGSDVSSVTFTDSTGSNNNGTLTVVTNLGTVTFDHVYYQNDITPTGYTVSTDPTTGLQRITLAAPPSSVFQLGTSGSYGIYTGVYLWSNTANWVGGNKPGNGGIATFNIDPSHGNPTGVDDIADLYLDSLSMPQGYLAVVGTLQIGKLTLGAGTGEIFASTIPGNSSAALTIDGLAGSEGMFIGADGAGAVTTIDATTDPGEYYEANEGGEVVFNPAPSAASYLSFGNAPGGYVTTFAFENPGATVAANLDGVAVGDAIALPGSDVSSVTFTDSTGSNNNGTLTVVTNLGTVTFDHVYYQNDITPTGYTVSTDPTTGLQRITLAAPPSSVFQLGTSGSYGIYTGVYLWSNTANWVGGNKPGNGGIATFNIDPSHGNPTGVDDIADLYLDSLSMPQGYVAVVGTLQIGKLTLGAGTGEIFASTIPGNSSAALTIDGLAGSEGMFIGADGAGAVTTIDATTDPGEYYEANEGGEVVFNPAPSAASYLSFGNAPGGYVTTFAFENPGATVAANLDGVAVGDAIALPGSDVSSVTFTDSTGSNNNGTLTVVTNLGTVTFDHVYYQNDITPTGYTVSTDPTTGLEAITFLCFYAGTNLATANGTIRVEDITPGTLLKTFAGGIRPVRWLGRSDVSTRFADPLRALPVRIKAGALGENVPERDLLVSPCHAMFIGGILVQASALVDGTTIIREQHVPEIFSYYHVELATHELLIAEGAPAESFVDNIDRMNFSNWAERDSIIEPAPIEEMPYPRAKSHRQVPMKVRHILAERALLSSTTAAA